MRARDERDREAQRARQEPTQKAQPPRQCQNISAEFVDALKRLVERLAHDGLDRDRDREHEEREAEDRGRKRFQSLHGRRLPAERYFIPMRGPTDFFQPSEQPGLTLSQASDQAGNAISRTADFTVSRSAGATGTMVRLNFFPVVQGSLPELQF